MYLPRRFAETDLAELDALFARDAFITLISVADGEPFASHLPVLYSRVDEAIQIRGHWARPNPQVGHTGPALLIVHGPHAYVSPSWYTQPEDRVPTWNYAVAHLKGQLITTDDIETKRQIVSDLSAYYERGVGSSWQPQHGHPEFEPELTAIVGFVFEVSAIAMKFKLNQHHPAADVRGAVNGLRRVGRPNEHEVADLMADRLARRNGEAPA
ncbi:MAG: FMN-binding negative transcriptional regulator [Pseudomarimonas sp.]